MEINKRFVSNKYGKDEWTLVTIQSNECWCCGAIGKTTHHHAIPQRMEPKQNAIVPLCKVCHKKLHDCDIYGLLGFMRKMSAQLQGSFHKMINVIQKKGE